MLEKNWNPLEIESKLYEKWEKSGAFACGVNQGAEPFCIMIPPPNVTGSLHMGHALDDTLQDILVRYKRMKGYDVLWQVGTDHAGIATQMVVERQLAAKGVSRHDLGREEFVKKVWEWKAESGGTITKQLRCLGASLDWTRERFTMDEGLSKAVRKVFVTLYKDGLIYRDKRLVNWDSKLLTAISDLEVEQKEAMGKMWYFKYPIEGEKDKFITVGTTRPETMFGDTAVAVHPDDERYKSLIGKNCILPIMNRVIPIVADEYANPEKGTGAVKITPAHDFNDFEVGKRHNLEMINVLDECAKLNENAPKAYLGLTCLDARDKVVEEIKALGLLEKITDNPMTIPYGDRSGVVIEPWLTDQWFVDAPKLAVAAIKAVEDGDMKFVPQNWENTYFEWMRNMQPWCISRQLWWGHQIPVWYGDDGQIFCEETEEEAYAAAEKHYGKKVELKRDTDVLDTWFSSGLWPFSTLGWPDKTPELERYYPTSVLVTGFDLVFFWVARMMMLGLYFMKQVPFKTVYFHALVRDENGQKMSKSKGNVIDPLVIMNKYGTDSLRFTLAAMTAQGRDIAMSESRVEGYRNFATKIWNAARFCQMNDCSYGDDFNPSKAKLPINRWILSKAEKARQKIEENLDNYRFNEASNAMYAFAWGEFCDWYLEMAKPIFNSEDAAAKAETKATAAYALDRILVLLHPFMPFITEELWGQLSENRAKMLILSDWSDPRAVVDDEAEDDLDWVIGFITQIRSVRVEMNVPPSAKIGLSFKDMNDQSKKRLSDFEEVIKSLARISDITEGDGAKGSAQAVYREANLFIDLAGAIDFDKEKERILKEITKIKTDIIKFDKKLSNESFVSRAPKEVVEEEKRRKEEALMTCSKLEEAYARLN
ncbi:MAG: valine--tRNA ligase [Alphaproteobacteria bacterium]